MKVAIIDNLEGGLGDYCFERVAVFFKEEFEVVRVRVLPDGLPGDAAGWKAAEGIDAMVVAGSLESPLDDLEWIRGEEEFLRNFVETGAPVLGICFGHELIGSAFGGDLERLPGLRCECAENEILLEDRIFRGLGRKTRQVVNHSVQVSEAPPGFSVLARSAGGPVQAMKHQKLPVFGVQFHPEMDREIKVHDPSWRVLSDEELVNADGRTLMRNFIDIVKQGFS